jgi:hypothetical protein
MERVTSYIEGYLSHLKSIGDDFKSIQQIKPLNIRYRPTYRACRAPRLPR